MTLSDGRERGLMRILETLYVIMITPVLLALSVAYILVVLIAVGYQIVKDKIKRSN